MDTVLLCKKAPAPNNTEIPGWFLVQEHFVGWFPESSLRLYVSPFEEHLLPIFGVSNDHFVNKSEKYETAEFAVPTNTTFFLLPLFSSFKV